MANKRAERVWKRLHENYGSRFIEAFGPKPNDSWIAVIERLSDDQIAYGLRAIIRVQPSHPPTSGDFVKCAESMPVAKREAFAGPVLQAQLTEYAAMKLGITDFRSFTLSHVHARNGEYVGVVLERDGKKLGYTVANMQADLEIYGRLLEKLNHRDRNQRSASLPFTQGTP